MVFNHTVFLCLFFCVFLLQAATFFAANCGWQVVWGTDTPPRADRAGGRRSLQRTDGKFAEVLQVPSPATLEASRQNYRRLHCKASARLRPTAGRCLATRDRGSAVQRGHSGPGLEHKTVASNPPSFWQLWRCSNFPSKCLPRPVGVAGRRMWAACWTSAPTLPPCPTHRVRLTAPFCCSTRTRPPRARRASAAAAARAARRRGARAAAPRPPARLAPSSATACCSS